MASKKQNLSSFVFGVLFFASSALGVQVAAKRNGVKVTKEAKKSSSVVTTLKKGDTLEAIERKGLYWQVKTSGGESGFVSVLKVKRMAGSGGGIAQAIRAASEDGRSDGDEVENTRTRSAVMGVRGLDESDETQYAGNAKPNLRLVYQMEDHHVSKKSIERLENLVMKELESMAEN